LPPNSADTNVGSLATIIDTCVMPLGSTRLVTGPRPCDALSGVPFSASAAVAFSTASRCVGSVTPASFGAQVVLSPIAELPSTRLKLMSGAASGGLQPGAWMLGTEKGTPTFAASCAGQASAWEPPNTPSDRHPIETLVPIAT